MSAEQVTYDNTESGLTSTTVKAALDELRLNVNELASETGRGVELKLLWENASPESTFARQGVFLENLDAYAWFIIKFRGATTVTDWIFGQCVPGGITVCYYQYLSDGDLHGVRRFRASVDNNEIHFWGANTQIGTDPISVGNNNWIIPEQIYGIKGVTT